jgi:NAD(P)-dependent dehydrogenase (short-subunit alcohol dehydrogenase family)
MQGGRAPRRGLEGPPIALVTGANRGLGLEVCRQLAERGYPVVLGSRDAEKGARAAASIAGSPGRVLAWQLDVTSADDIERARARADEELGRLDALINNAAILYDTWQHATNADLDQVRAALETNTFGAWTMVRAFLPLLRRSAHPRVVNVSSESGSLASMGGGTPAYNLSKVALNAVTRMLAAELRRDRILVNSVCPGWVATDMGGPGGRPAAQGAAGIVWAATLPDDGPTGQFFRDARPLPW